jgi:peptidoglycan/LPS O-acetylase OafA/YrhL
VFLVVFAIYGSNDYSLSELIAPFLLLTNTPIVFADQTELTGTLWTITVLFQFYLIAPLLFIFMARIGPWRFLLPAVALIFIVKCMVLYANRDDAGELFIISYYSIVGRLNQFFIGSALAVLWPALMRLLAARWAGALALAASFAAIVAYCAQLNAAGGIMAWRTWHVLVPEIEAVLWAGFIAGFAAARPLALPWLGRIAAGVGLISYSLYIFHWPIHVIAWNVFGADESLMLDTLRDAAWFTTLVVLPASLLVAGLSYWCIERPFLMLRSRYVASKPVTEVRRAA